jgi:hypothetical protein
MATSGCPVLDFLKPMARFHLPFANMEETMVRSISFYLLRQYFNKKKGIETDFDLGGLENNYAEIAMVNKGIVARISKLIENGDADQNAITLLDCFALMLGMEIQSQLDGLEYLFEA